MRLYAHRDNCVTVRVIQAVWRRTAATLQHTFPADGSIPAAAGQPRAQRVASGCKSVNPRGCGAAGAAMERNGAIKGLSPRVRGSLA